MIRQTFAFLCGLALLLLCTSLTLSAQTNCEVGAGPLRRDTPANLKPAEMIQRIAANESAILAARRTYGFTQSVTVQTLSKGEMPSDWHVDGEYRSVIDVTHDAHGKRLEAVRFAPQSTLQRMSLEPEDFEDIRRFSIFALTHEELPQYNVVYSGQQHVDELDTYVFEVAPKTIEKGKRYYQGRLWVDSKDLQVVKTCGKSVPNPVITQKKRFIGKKVVGQGVQPTFATYRELIDGKYWFPTFSRSDDKLEFRNEEVRLKEVIRFSDYKPLGLGGNPDKRTLSSEKRP
jgi:hypothetical protein